MPVGGKQQQKYTTTDEILATQSEEMHFRIHVSPPALTMDPKLMNDITENMDMVAQKLTTLKIVWKLATDL
jgi:hypothetical protein